MAGIASESADGGVLDDLEQVAAADNDFGADAEQVEVSFGDDEDAAPASSEESGTQLVRHLRQQLRERDKELSRRPVPAAPVAVDPGPKPTLETCNWDEGEFETRFDAWKDAKAEAAKAADAASKARETEQAAWQSELARYGEAKSKLGVANFQDAEDAVTAALSTVQQAVIVTATDNPALVIAALGRHPGKLAEIAKIANPLKLAAALVKLEGTLKVTPTRKAPPPEIQVRGSAALSGTRPDKHLERLEAEAAKTLDRSKIIAYKRSLKA